MELGVWVVECFSRINPQPCNFLHPGYLYSASLGMQGSSLRVQILFYFWFSGSCEQVHLTWFLYMPNWVKLTQFWLLNCVTIGVCLGHPAIPLQASVVLTWDSLGFSPNALATLRCALGLRWAWRQLHWQNVKQNKTLCGQCCASASVSIQCAGWHGAAHADISRIY